MAQTGSLVLGTLKGMDQHLESSQQASGGIPLVHYILGNPDTLISSLGSDIAIDWGNGNVYISKVISGGTGFQTGSTWYKLGSTT